MDFQLFLQTLVTYLIITFTIWCITHYVFDFLAISATCACFLSMSDPVSLLTSYYVFGLFCRPRNGYVLVCEEGTSQTFMRRAHHKPVWGGHITNLYEQGTSQTFLRRAHHKPVWRGHITKKITVAIQLNEEHMSKLCNIPSWEKVLYIWGMMTKLNYFLVLFNISFLIDY